MVSRLLSELLRAVPDYESDASALMSGLAGSM